jgi:uncharacterized protein YndB with AHSA1/START domain
MDETKQKAGSGPTRVNTEGHRLVVRKRLPASREEVFAAWTDAEGMRAWMRPGPTHEARVTLDVRVGGQYRIDMIGQGQTFVHTGEYLEIDPPARLVFTWISEGTEQRASIVTIELEARGADETELVLTHEALPSAQSAEAHRGGWTEIVDNLAARLR